MLSLHSTASERCRLDEVRRRAYENRRPSDCRSPCQGLQPAQRVLCHGARQLCAEPAQALLVEHKLRGPVVFLYDPRRREHNPHLDTEYLAVLETDSATPYFLNLHNGEVPHTLILGMTGSGKTYLITFKELDVVSLRVIAATVETHGEHLAFLRADGWLAALVLAENLKSGSSCWHRALWISQAGKMFGDIGTVKITLTCNGEKYAHLCKSIGSRGENNPCP